MPPKISPGLVARPGLQGLLEAAPPGVLHAYHHLDPANSPDPPDNISDVHESDAARRLQYRYETKCLPSDSGCVLVGPAEPDHTPGAEVACGTAQRRPNAWHDILEREWRQSPAPEAATMREDISPSSSAGAHESTSPSPSPGLPGSSLIATGNATLLDARGVHASVDATRIQQTPGTVAPSVDELLLQAVKGRISQLASLVQDCPLTGVWGPSRQPRSPSARALMLAALMHFSVRKQAEPPRRDVVS